MGNTSDMPELKENAAAGGMHRVGHHLPAGHLRVVVDARRSRIALALRRDLRGFADDQPGARALGIIGGADLAGDIARARTIARHRRHHHAIGELQRAEAERREKVDVLDFGVMAEQR